MSREDDAGVLLTIAAGQNLYAAAATVHYALVGAIDTLKVTCAEFEYLHMPSCMLVSGLLSLWCLIVVLAVPGAAAQVDEDCGPSQLTTATLISVQAASFFAHLPAGSTCSDPMPAALMTITVTLHSSALLLLIATFQQVCTAKQFQTWFSSVCPMLYDHACLVT